MSAAMRAPGSEARVDPGGRIRQLFLRFDIGGERYALSASHIARILPFTPLKHLPAAPGWVAGILLYGEEPVPVVDVSALAIGRAAAARASTRIAVVDYLVGAGAPDRRLGLLLENATETVHYDPADFVPYGLDNRDARYLGPVRPDAEGLVQWVCIAELLTAGVRERLYQDAGQAVHGP